jgi:signal transduction histidine kinase
VLINLIGNALKFTDEGSIDVSFTTHAGFVKVYISDSGHGMNAEAQKLLFKKFEQTGETVLTRDSVRGTGLGLYISKMIIENMGGRIILEKSEEGKGTTFSFSLPVFNTQKPEIVTKSPLTRG